MEITHHPQVRFRRGNKNKKNLTGQEIVKSHDCLCPEVKWHIEEEKKYFPTSTTDLSVTIRCIALLYVHVFHLGRNLNS